MEHRFEYDECVHNTWLHLFCIHHIYMCTRHRAPEREKKVEVDLKPEPTPEPAIDTTAYLHNLADELHKPVRHKFPTRKVFFRAKDQTWCMDLADMSHWKDENDRYTFILTIVDGFTRWAAARPLKSKSATEVLAAVKDVVAESGRRPLQFWCDEGTEFLNKEMTKWRKENSIGMYHTYGRGKSVIVERFNRTLKTIMWRTLTANNSHAWVEILPKLIETYNETEHGVLKMSPNYASSHPEAAAEVWNRVRKKEDRKIPKSKFKVDDVVRVSRTKGVFEKGYDAGWSREEFKIAVVLPTNPPTYQLQDYNGEEIKGSFYEQEMQIVTEPGTFLVDEVLKERGKGDKKELFVSWLGWPSKFNSWIPAKDAQDLS